MIDTDQSLIILDGWGITIPPTAEQARQAILDDLSQSDIEGDIPANAIGQEIAQQIAAAMSRSKAFRAEVERVSKELREPYFAQAKKIKAVGDTFAMPVAEVESKLGVKLAEYEAEKKRIEINLERQRQAEAARLRREEEERQRQAEAERQRQEAAERDRLALIERERQRLEQQKQREIEEANRKAAEAKNAKEREAAERRAADLAAVNARAEKECEEVMAAERQRQAEAEAARDQQRQAEQQQLLTIDQGGVRFEAPKTEGVSVKVAYEFEIVNHRELAEWCWSNGRAWVNEVTFFKRDITEAINAPNANRNIPGLRVYQAVAANVRKARGPKTLTVQSRVEL